MPKLWDQTIDQHRRLVKDAILETTATLVSERGLRVVTMSEIAEQVGIGRGTLYKYFPDVDSILGAWHVRTIAAHLERLARVRDCASGDSGQRLRAVLETYADLVRESHAGYDAELRAHLHSDERLVTARHRLHALVRDLIADGAARGELRDDVTADELAAYCLHALSAADGSTSKAAVRRLVHVTVDGLRPTRARVTSR